MTTQQIDLHTRPRVRPFGHYTAADLDAISRQFEAAKARGDVGATALIAAEHFGAIVENLKRAISQEAAQ